MDNLPVKHFSDLARKERLSKGSYGYVHRCECDGKDVAVKFFKKHKMNQDDMDHEASMALSASSTGSRFILAPIASIIDKSKCVALAYPYVDNVRYRDLYPRLSLEGVKLLMAQLLTALDRCHRKSIAHCDVKPQNMVIDAKTLHLQLIDFGHARQIEHSLTGMVGTNAYRAPEILMGCHYDASVDIWSAGRVMLEMLYPGLIDKQRSHNSRKGQLRLLAELVGTKDLERHCPLDRKNLLPREHMHKRKVERYVRKMLPDYRLTFDADAMDLLDKMLKADPMKRISCSEALTHPFFVGVELDSITKD